MFLVKDFVFCDVVSCLMIMEIWEGCGVGLEKDYIYLYFDYLDFVVLVERLFGILEFVKIFVGVDVIK